MVMDRMWKMREKVALRTSRFLIRAIIGLIVVPFTETERLGQNRLELKNKIE